ncbi:hypothetical protein GA0115246_113091, partial [Streptomyces sp. SolWspMP-sol7th]
MQVFEYEDERARGGEFLQEPRDVAEKARAVLGGVRYAGRPGAVRGSACGRGLGRSRARSRQCRRRARERLGLRARECAQAV